MNSEVPEIDPRITADEYKMLLEWLSKMQDDLDELYRRLDEHTRKEGDNDTNNSERPGQAGA